MKHFTYFIEAVKLIQIIKVIAVIYIIIYHVSKLNSYKLIVTALILKKKIMIPQLKKIPIWAYDSKTLFNNHLLTKDNRQLAKSGNTKTDN